MLFEKDVLLKEIHHRVKNNLQIISSLVRLQAPSIKDKKTQTINQDFQNRIKAMSLVHETLYLTKSFGVINLGDYITKLVKGLNRSSDNPSWTYNK